MKKYLLHIVMLFCLAQIIYSQEDGVVAFSLPVRNSLKFNKYAINPTFSFVREQNKYISFTNKREWVQFDNAPQTYLFSYSGRFSENIGAGLGLFQQDYGVLTTFGGVANFAYNVVLDRDSNLTFGMNLGFYKSGINEGNVIINFPDPSLDNIPSNSIISINPGINYGTTFFDFGLSLNNIVSYNFNTSKIIEENPEQGIQAHIMYTGYINNGGFFDQSKFSTLVRSEFKKDKTVYSGIMMLNIPKGMWAQIGYNSLYGASGGIGFNLTNQISLEYNYEKAIGDLSSFGSSHEMTLAYKFKKNYKYNYGDDDIEGALITPAKKGNRSAAKTKSSGKTDSYFRANRIAKAQIKAEEEANKKLAAETKAKEDEEAKIKLAQETQAKADEEARLKAIADAKAKADEVARLKAIADAKAKTDEEARFKAIADAKAKADEEARQKLLQQARAKLAEEARLKAIADAKAKADEEARLKAIAEAKAKADEEARLKAIEDAKAKADEEARLKIEQEAQAKAADDARLKAIADAKAKADEEARIKTEELEGVLISKPTDANSIEMSKLTKLATDSKIKQEELLTKLRETVASRQKDLKDLKEENDLSEQGIFTEPKPFKSVTAENAALESLKIQLDDVIKSQDLKIKDLERLYKERLENSNNDEDSIAMIYLDEIEIIKKAQSDAKRTKASLVSQLEEIKIATEIERKRRIKRAAYDNEEARYTKDRAMLNSIKQNTPVSTVPLKVEDFDFGEVQSNIQIVKDVRNVEGGYYMVIAVHTDVEKRDEFLRKAVAAGQSNIDFFYDVNTSKYYIYYDKYDRIEEANMALRLKGTEPYNSKMTMVKIENQ